MIHFFSLNVSQLKCSYRLKKKKCCVCVCVSVCMFRCFSKPKKHVQNSLNHLKIPHAQGLDFKCFLLSMLAYEVILTC